MIVIHDPHGWALQSRARLRVRLERVMASPVGRQAREYPSRKAKAAEVATIHGGLVVLDELIDGLEAAGRRPPAV